MIEQECTPAVLVINPKASFPLFGWGGLCPPVQLPRPVTVIVADRAGFDGVFKLPTRLPEVE